MKKTILFLTVVFISFGMKAMDFAMSNHGFKLKDTVSLDASNLTSQDSETPINSDLFSPNTKYLDVFAPSKNNTHALLKVLLFVIIGICSYALCLLTMPVIIHISYMKNLMATPNSRSSHTKNIPNFGGVGIFFAVLFTSCLFAFFLFPSAHVSYLLSMLAAATVLFFMGLKDDVLSLSATKKFIIQIILSLMTIVLLDLNILNLHGVLWINELNPTLSYFFTIFLFLFIINSYNLIDGIDGLAGGFGVLIAVVFTFYFYKLNFIFGLVVSIILIGSLLAFLQFNLGKHKIFMGDSGSLVVGFILALLSVLSLSVKGGTLAKTISPVIILSMFAYPFIDVVRVMIVRIKNKQSPFKADKNHLHHVFLKKGFSHKQSTAIILLYSLFVMLTAHYFSYLSINYHLLVVSLIAIFSLILALKVKPKR